jgi:rhodanese-related sulfurtransferase
MKKNTIAFLLLSAVMITSPSISPLFAESKPVGIAAERMSVTAIHNGKEIKIERNQDNSATVTPDFALTSRPCPPFCIQPGSLGFGVETVGELEVLDFIEKMTAGDTSLLLIDSRTPDWVAKGTIPGAKNLPWSRLNPKMGATTEAIMKILQGEFNVKLAEGVDDIAVDEAIASGNAAKVFDYSQAKTLMLFCNGIWCGQSPINIETLLKFGYPGEKIKWYRGGLQDWSILGLTTVQ